MKRQHYFVHSCGLRELPKSGLGTYPGPWCSCPKPTRPRQYDERPCNACGGPALVGMRFCPRCYKQHKRAQREGLPGGGVGSEAPEA